MASTGACMLEVAGRSYIESRFGDRRRSVLEPVARTAALSRLMRRVCESHGIEIRVRGTLPSSPSIVIANHVSYIDPIVVGGLVPCVPISKGEVSQWPLVGAVGNALGVLFVRREDPHSGARVLRSARRMVEAGVSILNFPEGTTSVGDDVLPYERGIFGLALHTRVPVVPIALRYQPRALAWTGDAYFLPHYLETAARAVNAVDVIIGGPVPPFSSMTPDAYAALCRECTRTLLRS